MEPTTTTLCISPHDEFKLLEKIREIYTVVLLDKLTNS